MEPLLDNPTPDCEGKGCKDLSCFKCDDCLIYLCSYCMLLSHFNCECTRLELDLANTRFNFIVEGSGNPFNKIPMVVEGYIVNKFILEIMQKYLSEHENISTEGISKLFECEQNCIHTQTQIYETKFGNEGDRLQKVMRRCNNVILGFKNLLFKDNFNRISANPDVCHKLGPAMIEDIRFKLSQRVQFKAKISKLYPSRETVQEITEEVDEVETLLDEKEKEVISYQQIYELYNYSNNEVLEDQANGENANENMILDLPLHSKQYQKVLTNLKNFILPQIKGISCSSLNGDQEDLIELCQECLTGDLEIASLTGFFRKGPRFKSYLDCLLPRVTKEIFIGWFTFEKRDLEKLMKICANKKKFCLERCNLLIPHNSLPHFSQEENEFIESLEEDTLDFSTEERATLPCMNLYDTKFTEKAFEIFIKALENSSLGDSIYEIYVYRLEIPKQVVKEITKNSKFEIVFS
ncbi:unnamed protein product [Moneuplotes crassus]|uniref:Uncharacterized protein n=1 Tax=Euplotes crassus TaxID=5936 RepID=A0AAD1XAM1_EUPCR|nr:unnamed protein product [Moneuplotes crassus]